MEAREMEAITKEHLGLAAEFAVASELCRRNAYAQLTLGARKRTDLLVEASEGTMLRIEVKGKQGNSWPNCKGIFGHNAVLVLVDFARKSANERADFYILTSEDWLSLVNIQLADGISKGTIRIDEMNVPIWLGQSKQGTTYRGMGVNPHQVEEHRERWDKITMVR
jgi:hypothetical protein